MEARILTFKRKLRKGNGRGKVPRFTLLQFNIEEGKLEKFRAIAAQERRQVGDTLRDMVDLFLESHESPAVPL